MKTINIKFKLLSLIVFISLPLRAEEAQPNPIYSFGVVPQHAANKITRQWTPILDWISKRCNCQLKVRTAKNIPEFEKQLSLGKYDYAYMNPYHFTVFNQKPGYQAVARQKDKTIHGILVTRKDSLHKNLSDLQGSPLAFPSPAAFAASILTQSNLELAGVEFTPSYVSSHDSVYLTVSKGIFSAGGGVVRTFNKAPDKVKNQLRILWKSDGYTPHAIAVHPRVPKSIQATVKKALLKMGSVTEGKKLLRTLNFKNGLKAAHNHDWDEIKNLNIKAPVLEARQ